MEEPVPDSVELHRYSDVGARRARLEVVECPRFERAEDGVRWMKQVAGESRTAQVHFFRRDADGFAWWPTMVSSPAPELDAARVLADDLLARKLVAEGEVVRLRVQAGAGPARELAHVPPRAGKNANAPTEIQRVWTPAGLEAEIEADLNASIRGLTDQLRSPLGVLPFVGAGMSAGFGFPQWREFLDQLAARTFTGEDLAKLQAEANLEVLAERLWKRDEDAFQKAIEATFSRSIEASRLRAGPLATLAHLVQGPVITTNFDHVLEDTFEASGLPFMPPVHGARPDLIVAAIHRDQRRLLKIHGDCSDRTLRTFTLSEYDLNYADTKGAVTLTSLGWLLFTQRPLLFLGSSLESDRTVGLLKTIHAQLGGVTHYAVIAAKYRERKLVKRRNKLNEMGIAPLWFEPGDFSAIDRYLLQLLELTNSRELRAAPARTTALSSAPPPDRSLTSFVAATDGVIAGTTRRIASAIAEGRMAFLLGNYVHLGAIRSGDVFYKEMAAHFDVPDHLRDRSEIARYVLDRTTPEELLGWYRRFIDVDRVQPSRLVTMLVELSRFLRVHRRAGAAGITLLTTNYDTVLERTLDAIGEPFHLFYYLNDGAFAYRSPAGAERIVERPERFSAPRDEHVCVVKLNGGLVHGQAIPHSVSIARGDFERLAARLPSVLPAGVRARIEGRSLLCLGHGLYELDVDQLIRHVHSIGPRRVSWAVQKVPAEFQGDFATRREYWRPIGLEIVDQDLAEFTDELGNALAQAVL